MNKTRASFKLAVRYCRQHEDMIRADILANSIVDKEYRAFWKHVHNQQKGKAVNHAAVVGGCAGEKEIAKMWGHHFEQLYNSINDDRSKNFFYECLDNSVGSDKCTISVHDLLVCISKQKKGKSVGLDDIAMEAFIYGGLRLLVHVCFLFDMFIKVSYLPQVLIQSVIIPLVKCKSGNLSDVNNYRAIAISTAMSKLLESVIASQVVSSSEIEKYQFGFKAEHSTGICSNVFKQTVNYYVNRGSHVFACFIDFRKAFDYVNYWKLFTKSLQDNIDSNIVSLLAYWYSHQELCVRWISNMSGFFYGK